MYITMCKIDDQCKFDAWSRALKAVVVWNNSEGWGGEGGGRRVQDGGHKYTCDWFLLMYGKNIIVK